MYLLNVKSLELKFFVSEKETPPYAILSHTWYAAHEEVSFQDIKQGNSNDPAKKLGLQKIVGCCKLARQDNFGYVWIDTCCIDQNSTSDLDEAIISMFRWYQRADVCYAYLEDVHDKEYPTLPADAFHNSRWFTRGWTLQELLAPAKLRFYTSSWELIAQKEELAMIIQEITGIPHSIVSDSTDMVDIPVAQRMSWAANRQTTREEDHAYCLVSLFDVRMIKQYGEGAREAFIRLQRAILEKTGDDSLFSWGLDLNNAPPAAPQPDNQDIWASSPSDFRHCSKIAHGFSADPVTITPNGVSISVAFTEHSGKHYGLLSCRPQDSSGYFVGMPLQPSDNDQTFYRAHDRVPVLLTNTSAKPLRTINVRNRPPRRQEAGPSWSLYIKHSSSGLNQVGQFPVADWSGSRAKISLVVDAQVPASNTKWSIAQFQPSDQVTGKLLLVVLEVNLQLGPGREKAYCHLMTTSQTTPLEDVYDNLPNMRLSAFGHHSVSFGNYTISATLETATDSVSITLLRRQEARAGAAVDADQEIEHIKRRLDVASRLSKRDDALQQAQETERVSVEKTSATSIVSFELEDVKRKIRDLEEDRRKLQERLDTLSSEQQEAGRAAISASEELRGLDNGIEAEVRRINEAEGGGRDWIARAVSAHHRDDVSAPRRNGLDTDNYWSTDATIPDAWNNTLWPITQLIKSETTRGQASDTDPTAPPIRCPESHGAVVRAFYHGRLSEANFLLRECVFSKQLSAAAKGWLLMHAASVPNKEVVQALIKRNAPKEVRDANQYTTLMHAVSKCDLDMTRHLLACGADINADLKRPSGFRMLPHVIESSRDDIATLLIQNRIDLNNYQEAESTPLTAAVKELNHAMVKLLLDSGATPTLADRDGNLPIAHAVHMGSLELVLLLLSWGSPASASFIAEGQCKASIAGLAAGHPKTDILRCLLDRLDDYAVADARLPRQPSKSPIIYAAETGNVKALEILVKAKYSVDDRWEDGSNALIFAAENKRIGMVKHLLNMPKSEGLVKEAFKFAAIEGNLPAIKVLVECGARPRVSPFNDTPIRLAKKHNHDDVVAYLRSLS